MKGNNILDDGDILRDPEELFPNLLIMKVQPKTQPISVDWSPLVTGGANFKTNKLVVLDTDHIAFKASLGRNSYSPLNFRS